MKSVGELKPEPSTTCWTRRYRGRGILTVTLDSRTAGSWQAPMGPVAPGSRPGALLLESDDTPKGVSGEPTYLGSALTPCSSVGCFFCSAPPAPHPDPRLLHHVRSGRRR